MTMDIARTSERIPILCVEDFNPHCLFVPCLGLWTIFVVVPIQQMTKKAIIFIKNKANTDESEFVDG